MPPMCSPHLRSLKLILKLSKASSSLFHLEVSVYDDRQNKTLIDIVLYICMFQEFAHFTCFVPICGCDNFTGMCVLKWLRYYMWGGPFRVETPKMNMMDINVDFVDSCWATACQKAQKWFLGVAVAKYYAFFLKLILSGLICIIFKEFTWTSCKSNLNLKALSLFL